MPNLDTFEGRAIAGAQEHYEQMMPGLTHAIAVLAKRRDETHDTNVRYGLGVAIDILQAEVRFL